MKRHVSEQHRVSKSQPTVANALTDYLMLQCGVKVTARVHDDTLMVRADDYADWLLARKYARENFGFDANNVVREF